MDLVNSRFEYEQKGAENMKKQAVLCDLKELLAHYSFFWDIGIWNCGKDELAIDVLSTLLIPSRICKLIIDNAIVDLFSSRWATSNTSRKAQKLACGSRQFFVT